jgi:hypothetical protein
MGVKLMHFKQPILLKSEHVKNKSNITTKAQ